MLRLALCLTAGLGLAACGTRSGRGDTAPADALHAAVLATEHAATTHFTTITFISGSSGSTGPSAISEEGDIRFQGPEVQFTSVVAGGLGHAPQEARLVLVDHVAYEGLSEGNTITWQRGATESDFPVFGVMTAQGLLTASNVTDTGRSMVGNTSATEFAVHILGGRLGTGFSVHDAADSPGQGKVPQSSTVQPYDVLVWVGPHNLIVRIEAKTTLQTASVHPGTATRRLTATTDTTETLADFGEPVSITIPNASNTG